MLVGLGTGRFAFGKQDVPLFGQPLVPEYLLGDFSLDLLVEHPHAFQYLVHLVIDVEENGRGAGDELRLILSGFPTLSNSARAFLAASR